MDTVEFFTTNSDLLVFVINPNYVSIRQGIKYLEHITKVWKIKKEKITIIVNNFKEGSLEFSVIETIFNEYNVCYGLSYIKDFENYLNGNKKYVGFKINIKPILNYININGKENAKEGM